MANTATEQTASITLESKNLVNNPSIKCYQAKTLFADAREVVIEHLGEQYSLRMTKQGKLLLTK